MSASRISRATRRGTNPQYTGRARPPAALIAIALAASYAAARRATRIERVIALRQEEQALHGPVQGRCFSIAPQAMRGPAFPAGSVL